MAAASCVRRGCRTDCIVPSGPLKPVPTLLKAPAMTELSQLDAQMTAALARLKAALDARTIAAPGPDAEALHARIRTLEGEKAELEEELERLRSKRDKDVAALDELIAQLKPLIEEV